MQQLYAAWDGTNDLLNERLSNCFAAFQPFDCLTECECTQSNQSPLLAMSLCVSNSLILCIFGYCPKGVPKRNGNLFILVAQMRH